MFFVWAGWPAASGSFTFVAVIIGLGSVTPDPRAMTVLALIVAVTASVLAAILEYFILDGVSDFPLLAVGLAPFIIGAALLISSPNRLQSGLGRLNLIFITTILSPSNPQNYDPQSFLFRCLFVAVAAGLLLAGQCLFPPVSESRRRRRLLESARLDLERVLSVRGRHETAEEAMHRDAARI